MSATLAVYAARVALDIGYHEGPNNSTPYGRWYASKAGSQYFANAPWCDMATSFWADQVGAADIFGFFAYTPSHAQWFINRGQWSWTPVRGGVAFWDWSGSNAIGAIDHVSALIESVDGGQAVTIDGNYADRVARWRHPMSQFVGCGLPAYSSAPPPPPPPVTGEIPTQSPHGWVYMSKLHRGQLDSDSVRHYQQALRDYPNISTIPLNPSGVTGNYGSETALMTEKVYRTFDSWQPGHGWASGDLSEPGPALLQKLGLTILPG